MSVDLASGRISPLLSILRLSTSQNSHRLTRASMARLDAHSFDDSRTACSSWCWNTRSWFLALSMAVDTREPGSIGDRDYDYVADHPVAAAYWAYCAPGHDRPTWDLTSVLHGVFPDAGYFALSPPGRVVVKDDGYTVFEERKGGPHRYLIAEDRHVIQTREALVQLSSQPPRE